MAFAAEEAHEVGRLVGVSGVADVVDAHVVVVAAVRNATVLTSDADDLRLLSGHFPVPIRIEPFESRHSRATGPRPSVMGRERHLPFAAIASIRAIIGRGS